MASSVFELVSFFRQSYSAEESSAIATLKTLHAFLNHDTSGTVAELSKNIRSAIDQLKQLDCRTEVESVAEIFFRFITLSSAKFEFGTLELMKAEIKRRSELYMHKVVNSRQELARNAHNFIPDGCKILVHSMSRAVLETLKEANAKNKHFAVFVTESAPDNLGRKMFAALEALGIHATLILDAAIGYILERIDIVLVGAEGVAESGGIINKIGTYPLAICSKAHNKPFYVLAESYKFIRLYPLRQADIPERLKWRGEKRGSQANADTHPLVDYTPPMYINLLLTDLGTLTTAAVCDTLLLLYT